MAIGKLTAKTGSEGDFELVPEGQQVACLVAIIDEGTQDIKPGTHNKEWTKAHKVLLIWEALETTKKEGEPFLIAEEYTFSFDAKANLRKMIQGWLGKTFPDNTEYDWAAPVEQGGILGRCCLLTIEHNTSAKGKAYAKLNGVAGIPNAMRESAKALKANLQTVPFVWDVETPEMPDLASTLFVFGQKLSDRLTGAHERANLNAQHSQETARQPPAQVEKGAHGGAVLRPGTGITPPSPAELARQNAAAQPVATVDDDSPF